MIWLDLFNNWFILAIIFLIVAYAWIRGVRVYEEFIRGAKEGFDVAVLIIPYLVAILCAVALFRASGAMQVLQTWLAPAGSLIGMHSSLIPLALLKPLSGGGSRGLMIEIWETEGVDSLPGFTASVMQGSAETTFYILAVYCGAVAVRRTRGVLGPLLLGDLAGFIAAVLVSRWYCAAFLD